VLRLFTIGSSAQALYAVAAVIAGVAAGIVTAPSPAQETPPPRTLVPGKGSDLTTARCATCHDAQHITRTRLSRGEWEYNIKNMIERGAPVAPHEIPIILDYLAAYYNRDSAPPPPDPSAAAYGLDGGAGGSPVARLLATHACVACHQLDQRLVGPSFREVAAKFSNDGAAPQKLAKTIRDGGAGNWGSVPMPPHPAIPEADLEQIVGWILQQK
jgi:sulfite dehydrogenase